MWGAIIGGAIGAGASLIGGKKSRDFAAQQDAQNAAMQREFAQHGIRWRVSDAKKAGLHPLYALQGSGATFTPTVRSDPWGPAISQAGAHIGRGVEAAINEKDRKWRESHEYDQIKTQTILGRKQVERAELENEMLRKQIEELGSPDAVDLVPDRQVMARPGKDHLTAGKKPLFTEYQGPGYRIMLPYSEEGPTEALQVGIPQLAWILAENMRYYGPGWAPEIRKYLNVPAAAWKRAKELLVGPAEIMPVVPGQEIVPEPLIP